MTDPSSEEGDGGEYLCSVCQKTDVVFSKRQWKRAQRGDSAKCKICAELEDEEAVVEEIDEPKENEDFKQGDAVDQEEAEPMDTSSSLSKEEKKRLKKEKKRLRKEEKKKAKKERKQKSGESVPSEGEEEASEASFSSVEAEEEKAKFSEDEAKFSDQEEAHFSDQEILDKENAKQDNKEGGDAPQIPRKRKSKANSSSLIANLQATEPKVASAAIMTTASEEVDFRDSDEEEYDDPGSLSTLKENILGRKIRSHDDEDEEDVKPPAQYTTDCKISHQLRKELACAICHECFLHPVTLLCGHSFCKECIQWWIQSSSSPRKSCPTCRLEVPIRSASSLGVNTALRACVLALLANEVQIRMEAQRHSRKGENEGAHDGGYEVLVDATADSWKTPGIPWSCRRSSVLDAEDQRMQLAMAIWKDSTRTGVVYNPRDCMLRVSLCMLHMEEDEVADGGFPRVIHEDDDEDNEQLLVSRSGGRFVHSFVRATACTSDGKKIPLGRRGIQASGIVELCLDLSSPEVARSDFISFEHEESGAVLDLKVPSELNGKGGPSRPPSAQSTGRTASTALELDDDDDGEHRDSMAYDDSEDDGSHLDRFENDGFIADEADDGEHHEDDLCAVCKEAGELMVCDGGDNIEGCGKSFHVECVNRDEIPRGDWICKECAETLDLDVGIEGHEFPLQGFCEKCQGDGVEIVCDSGDDEIAACGKKFHRKCVNREEFPSGNWICQDCALNAGLEVGLEGCELPDGVDLGGDDVAIEIDDSEPEKSSPPAKKKRKRIDPKDVIDLEDSDEEDPEFEGPAKGGRHIGDDSDDEEEKVAEDPPGAKNGRHIGEDSDDEELEILPPSKKSRTTGEDSNNDDGDEGDEDEDDDEELEVLPPKKNVATSRRAVALDEDEEEDE